MSRVKAIDVALVQLRNAIQLYNRGSYISAITLSGAAEEILGQIAKRKTGKNATLDEKVFIDQLANFFKKPAPDLKKVIKSRNRARNSLKHNDSGKDFELEADFEFEAEQLILGSIRNYELITGKQPKDRVIRNFWNWISM